MMHLTKSFFTCSLSKFDFSSIIFMKKKKKIEIKVLLFRFPS